MTALTIPVITNFAVDAAMAVALANTLFFAAATGESKVSVALYLALTIAPFAVIAPLIGPVLDRLQRGRRIAMATTFGLRALLAVLIIANSDWNSQAGQLHYDPWVLYPCALGMMVLSKSFGVLKSAVTPRVVPPAIDPAARQLATDHLRPDLRHHRGRGSGRSVRTAAVQGATAARAECIGVAVRARHRRRRVLHADSGLGGGDRGRGPHDVHLPR